MRAPAFWWREQPGAASLALWPVAWIWGAVAAAKLAKPGAEAGLPVVCAGNFVAGGAGKTPTAIACAQILRAGGHRPVFLTRGYGGSAARGKQPLRVDPEKHDARVVGDEALLLVRHGPVVVAADRIAGAKAAAACGDVVVMDDGLQNPALAKDFVIAVADGETGAGNGLCIPAGPLRAPLDAQLALVDALIVIGSGDAGERLAGRAAARGIPVFRGALAPDAQAAARLRGERVVAFAGIGRPEKFFATLEHLGADVRDGYSFDDHQMLDAGNLRDLRALASTLNARLVTTEKDMARLRHFHDLRDIDVLPVSLALDDETHFGALMSRKIARA